jgi:nitroreductase
VDVRRWDDEAVTTCDAASEKLHPALAGRFSPVRFEPGHVVSDDDVDLLLDAARRAPSAGNAQPWRFAVGRRADAVHRRLVPHLARSSSRWAPEASLLVVNLTQVLVEGTDDLEYSEFSHYDLGQAVAHMSVQGLAMGLAAHQFRAFDRDGVERELAVPTHLEVVSMTAFGVAAHAPGEIASAGTSRQRLTPREITWTRD